MQSAFESMENSDNLFFSNALWQCGISFSNAKYAAKLIVLLRAKTRLVISPLHCSNSSLKKKDSQRIWIFTNDDSPQASDTEEADRIQKQVQVTFLAFLIVGCGGAALAYSFLFDRTTPS